MVEIEDVNSMNEDEVKERLTVLSKRMIQIQSQKPSYGESERNPIVVSNDGLVLAIVEDVDHITLSPPQHNLSGNAKDVGLFQVSPASSSSSSGKRERKEDDTVEQDSSSKQTKVTENAASFPTEGSQRAPLQYLNTKSTNVTTPTQNVPPSDYYIAHESFYNVDEESDEKMDENEDTLYDRSKDERAEGYDGKYF